MNKKQHYVPLKGSEIPIISKSLAEWKAPANSQETVEVSLYLRGKPSGPDLPTIEEMTGTPLPQRKHISDEEFEKRYRADFADAERVRLFARNYGLEILDFNLSQRRVSLTGTVSKLESAFAVTLSMYRYKDVCFRGYEKFVYIPKDLDGIVVGVFGLSNAILAVTRMCISHPTSSGWLFNLKKDTFNVAPFFTPPQLAQAYRFPKGATGRGQTIGILQFGGGYTRDSLDEYFGLLNALEESGRLRTPFIIPVNCGLDNAAGKDWCFDLEVMGTIEVASAIANDAQLMVYFGNIEKEGENGFLKAVQAAVFDNQYRPSTISINMGIREDYCSDGFKNIMSDWLFRAAAVKNITVCVATGNTGSSDTPNPLAPQLDKLAHTDFPASSPWVLACGGTRLITDGNSIKSEVVWNEGVFLGASGGGVSEYFKNWPPYQEENDIRPRSVNPGHKPGRGIPDVAGNSSWQSGNLIMNIGGQFGFYAGTSAVAPMWCALIARLNEKLGTRLGFVNPILYLIRQSGAFNDITEGNNQNIPDVPGYYAREGWDACTGLGSPNGEKLYRILRKMLQKG